MKNARTEWGWNNGHPMDLKSKSRERVQSEGKREREWFGACKLLGIELMETKIANKSNVVVVGMCVLLIFQPKLMAKKCNIDKLVLNCFFLHTHSSNLLPIGLCAAVFFSHFGSFNSLSVAFRLDYYTFRSVLINLCTPVYHTLFSRFLALFRGRLNTTEHLDVFAHSSYFLRSFVLLSNA